MLCCVLPLPIPGARGPHTPPGDSIAGRRLGLAGTLLIEGIGHLQQSGQEERWARAGATESPIEREGWSEWKNDPVIGALGWNSAMDSPCDLWQVI